MTMRLRARALAIGSLVAIAAGWWWVTGQHSTPPTGVVVITLDTTRADYLSPYGFMDVSLPHLERLAREGVVFDRATSVAPLTLPSHSSLFTGLLPPHHGVRDNADAALAEGQTTLAEVLKARGFQTGGFVGSVVLDPDRGLAQGFQRYGAIARAANGSPPRRQRRGDEVMDEAIAWLETVGASPFFLWAHLYDPHRPYDPPDPYRERYAHNLYLGEIAFADSQIGRLLDALEQRRLLDRTVVIVTADHGESLGAHGERDHGIFVYEEVVSVPLIIRGRGLIARRIADVVRLTDLMPTALDLLQVPAPPMDGVSLVDLMHGRVRGMNLDAYSESLYPERMGWSSLRALRSGPLKLIDAPRPELYDLDQDPFEEHNLHETRRATADSMKARLAAIAGDRARATTGSATTPDLQARLSALGYVAGSPKHDQSGRSDRPDPKDCIGKVGEAAFLPPGLSCGRVPPQSELQSR
jgi:arylsulfatase A-like enzyme